MDWSVPAFHEGVGEAVDVEALDAGFATEASIEELHICVRMVGEEVDSLELSQCRLDVRSLDLLTSL